MVFINLDDIVQYQPPISEPACKPPWLSSCSAGEANFPLDPRLPKEAGTAHPNELDSEGPNFGLVETENQVASDTYRGDRERHQDDYAVNVRRQELDDSRDDPEESHSPPVMVQSSSDAVTYDSHSGPWSDYDEASLPCQVNDALPILVSSVPQQHEEYPVPGPGEEISSRDLPRSCSVSVAAPVSQCYRPDITSARRSPPEAPHGIFHDELHADYENTGDDNASDISALPHPTKRQKQSAVSNVASTRVRNEAPYPLPTASAQSGSVFADPYPSTSLHDSQTIPIQGLLTREIRLSRVFYSLTFEERREPSCLHDPARNPMHGENKWHAGHTKPPGCKKSSSMHTIAKHSPYLPEDDDLLVELKERRHLPWSRIAKHFPGRTKNALQFRYYAKLKNRKPGSLRRDRNGRTTSATAAATASQETCDLNPGLRTADSRRSSVLSTRQRYGPPRDRRTVDRYSPA